MKLTISLLLCFATGFLFASGWNYLWAPLAVQGTDGAALLSIDDESMRLGVPLVFSSKIDQDAPLFPGEAQLIVTESAICIRNFRGLHCSLLDSGGLVLPK